MPEENGGFQWLCPRQTARVDVTSIPGVAFGRMKMQPESVNGEKTQLGQFRKAATQDSVVTVLNSLVSGAKGILRLARTQLPRHPEPVPSFVLRPPPMFLAPL